MTSDSSPSLRERRRRETRTQIHGAAVDLVDEHGFDAVTVEMISERAGVSVRTFFNYFGQKEAALVQSLPPLPDDAVRDFLASSGPEGLISDLAELAVRQLADHGFSDLETSIRIVLATPALAKLQFSIFADVEAQFATLIARRLGLAVDDERSELLAAVFMTCVRVAGQRWSRQPDRRSLPDEIRACMSLLDHMLLDAPRS